MATMTTSMQQIVGRTYPPELGGTALRPVVDELMGVPYENPNYALEGYNEQGHFNMSTAQLLFGQGKTNLGELIVLQQLLRDNFYTSVLAPIQVLGPGESLSVQMDQITFHPILPQITPEEGRSRIASWSFNSETQVLNREALSAEFGHEFLYDPKGQAIARKVMDQLNNGIEEGNKFGVMWAYAHVPDQAIMRDLQKSSKLLAQWGSRAIDSFFARTKRYFGIFQAEDKAHLIIDNLLKEEMGEYGGEADSYLVPFALIHYVTVINPLFTTFNLGGEKAVQTLERGVEAFGKWGTSNVYICRAYDTDRARGPVDLLKRRFVYSEYYVMWDHLRAHYGTLEGYQSSWRNVQIMDGDRDARAIVSIRDALLATGRWGMDGKMISIDDPMMNDYDVPLTPEESRDTFHYTARNGEQKVAQYWGQVPNAFLSTRTLLAMAETALRSTSINPKELSGAIRTLQDAILVMRRVPYDSYLEDYLMLIARANQEGRRGERHDRRVGCPTIDSALLDWVPNQFGGMNLPEQIQGTEFDERQTAVQNANFAASLAAFIGGNTPAVVSAADANGNIAIQHPDYPNGSLRGEVNAGNTTLIYNPFKRISGRFALPPLFASGPGFKFITDAARTTSNRTEFQKRFGNYNYEMFLKIADAVEKVTESIEPLRTRFPNSALLDRNYGSSHFHNPDEFTVLIENLIGQGGVPLFLRRQVAVKGASTAAQGASGDRDGAALAAGGGRRPLNVVEFERAVEVLTGLSSKAADHLENTLTGKLTTVRNALGRYAVRLQGTGDVAGAANAVTIPPVASVAANLAAALPAVGAAGAAGAIDAAAVVFDPFQNGASAPEFTAFANIERNLPAFAKARFADNKPNARAVTATANLFGVGEDIALGNAAIKSAFDKLVRHLFNYRKPVPDNTDFNAQFATDYANAEGGRLAALSLLTLVNQSPNRRTDDEAATVAAIAARFNHLFTNLLESVGVVPPADGVQTPVLSFGALSAGVRRYLALPDVKTLRVFEASRTEQVILDTIGAAFEKAAEVGEQLRSLIAARATALGAAPPAGANAGALEAAAQARRRAVLRYDPADYMRTPLVGSDVQFSSHYDYVTGGNLGYQRLPVALFADPVDTEKVVSQLDQERYTVAIREGQPVPPTLAPTFNRSKGLAAGSLQAALNVRTLRAARLLAPLTQNTVDPASYEQGARRSETYAGPVAYKGGSRGGPATQGTTGSQNFWGSFSGGGATVTASGLGDDDDGPAPMEQVPSYETPAQRGVTSSVRCLSLANMRNDLDSAFEVSTFQEHWDEIEREGAVDAGKALVAKIAAATPTDWLNVEAFIDGNVLLPVTPVLVRPLIVFNTYTIYKVKAGADTAITFIARPLTNWGNDAGRQTYQLQMSYYSKTIVHNKKNVQALPNVFICGLERGFGMSFFTRKGFRDVNNAVTNTGDSLISLLEPYDPYLTKQLPSVFPLTGKFAFAQFSFADDPTRDNRLCYFNVKWANLYWGFYNRSKQELTREADRLTAVGSTPKFEFYTHGGQVLHYNPREGKFSYKRAATGYIPDRVYGPGMVRVWKDSTQSYPKQDFANMTDI